MDFRIKEKSLFAYIAKKVLKANGVAMVLGRTIHLSGVNSQDFLMDRKWVRHELTHIKQFKEYGFCKFIFLYFIESCKKGYYNNKFEVEARRAAESAEDLSI